ncbi:unnamed protein product, partial [Discosporangium mesarthrocarpum]
MDIHSERASPYKLAICGLIGYFLEGDVRAVDSDEEHYDEKPLELSPRDYRCLASIIMEEMQQVERAEEKGLGTLQESIKASLGKELGERLAARVGRRLCEIDSLDRLIDVIGELREMLDTEESPLEDPQLGRPRPAAVGRSSVFGAFLRRFLVTCEGAPFRNLSLLYSQLREYTSEAAPGTAEPGKAGQTGEPGVVEDDSMDMDDSSISFLSPNPPGIAHSAGPGSGSIRAFLEEKGLGNTPGPPGLVGDG